MTPTRQHEQRIPVQGRGPRRAVRIGTAVAAAGLAAAGFAAAAPAIASPAPTVSYHFRTLNNSNDLTFNQLLGINSRGVIAGYYGSGEQGHKNKGYLLLPNYRQSDYRVENFPGSAQTQVTGLNDNGVTVGFYSRTNKANPANNANFGFYKSGGHFHAVSYPTSHNSTPPVNQLLGVNDSGIAVGFYLDAAGNAHGYRYNIKTHRFSRVVVPGAVSLTAAAINNLGSVAGFYTNSHGATRSFLLRHNGTLVTFAMHGAAMTQAFGVNDSAEVVGAYTMKNGDTFGFTWEFGRGGFRTVSDPHGIGTTLVNGVNDAGDLVGFYTGAHGSTNGFLAKP